MTFDELWASPVVYGPYQPILPMYGPWLPPDFDIFRALDQLEEVPTC